MSGVSCAEGAREVPPLIFRQVAFTLPAFDRLKDYQRHFACTEGRRLTNGEVLDRLILANPQP